MNAGVLLDALPLVGDSSERIGQIRKIAVALAISGKLDAHAVSLRPTQIIEAVERVKAVLVKQRAISKQKQRAQLSQSDLPDAFSDPSLFAPLGEIAQIEKGKTGIKQAQPGPFPLVVTAAERGSCNHFDFDGAAAIIPLVSSTGHGNASLNRLHYQEGKFALGTILVGVFPYEPRLISARFIFEYLMAFKDELLVSRMTGTANVTLTIGGIAGVPIPLVCPEVQKRVDEIMVICDRFEAARAEREATRDQLAASSLARLNVPDLETFQDDARFVLNALPNLTTRPDQIKQLRQTILNLAVRGKLVPQDPNDGSAAELLTRIAADKAERAVSVRDRRAAKIWPLVGNEAPSPIPWNWVWASLGDITISRDGERIAVSREEREQREKIYDYYGASGVIDKIDGYLFDKPLLLIGEDGANLINRSTPIAFVARGKYWVNNHAHVLDGISEEFLRYVELFINATDLKPYVTGTAQPKMNQAKMNSIPVALPPLAEQRRIVAKVDELMSLCDQLVASLADANAVRRRLLDALLVEALKRVDFEKPDAVA